MSETRKIDGVILFKIYTMDDQNYIQNCLTIAKITFCQATVFLMITAVSLAAQKNNVLTFFMPF